MNDENDQAFLHNSKQLLDKQLAQLDAETTNELIRRRRRILADQQPTSSRWNTWPSYAATAAVLVVATAIWLQVPKATLDDSLQEDIALLTADEDLDFFEEIEFYQWLDAERAS
jgi:type VI protein secretion system component VasF